MRINEIAECCNAINYLRGAIARTSMSDPRSLELTSDLLLTYQELHDHMVEEIKFLESVSIK